MKVTMFAMRTSDIRAVNVPGPGNGTLIMTKDSGDLANPFAVYRIDADLPETWSGRVNRKSPYLDEAINELRRAVVENFASDGTQSLERGGMLKDLLRAVEDKTDEELAALTRMASTGHHVLGGLVAQGPPKVKVEGRLNISINALDAKSVVERSPDIARAIADELRKRDIDLD